MQAAGRESNMLRLTQGEDGTPQNVPEAEEPLQTGDEVGNASAGVVD